MSIKQIIQVKHIDLQIITANEIGIQYYNFSNKILHTDVITANDIFLKSLQAFKHKCKQNAVLYISSMLKIAANKIRYQVCAYQYSRLELSNFHPIDRLYFA